MILEIRSCRYNSWAIISSRQHSVLRVFVADAEGLDLMLIGRLDLRLRMEKISLENSHRE